MHLANMFLSYHATPSNTACIPTMIGDETFKSICYIPSAQSKIQSKLQL